MPPGPRLWSWFYRAEDQGSPSTRVYTSARSAAFAMLREISRQYGLLDVVHGGSHEGTLLFYISVLQEQEELPVDGWVYEMEVCTGEEEPPGPEEVRNIVL